MMLGQLFCRHAFQGVEHIFGPTRTHLVTIHSLHSDGKHIHSLSVDKTLITCQILELVFMARPHGTAAASSLGFRLSRHAQTPP